MMRTLTDAQCDTRIESLLVADDATDEGDTIFRTVIKYIEDNGRF